MKITNKFHIPAPFQRAVEEDLYDGPPLSAERTISVTSLISPVQKVTLKRENEDALEMDISEAGFMLMGTAVHSLLERTKRPDRNEIAEKRFDTQVGGWTLTGKIDHWANGVLSDYKYTTVWNYQNVKEDWIQQLNVQAYLLRANRIEVNKLQIATFLRDFQRRKASDPAYPAHMMPTIPIEMWSEQEADEYVRRRIALFEKAWYEGIHEPCTKEERWFRGGKNIHCLGYCPVSHLCPQWALLKP